MELNQQGDKITGDFGGDKLEGTLTGNAIHFLAKDERGGTEELTATVQSGAISGSIVFVDATTRTSHHAPVHGHARSKRRAGPPQRHDFTPSTFYRQFSAANQPVLTVSPATPSTPPPSMPAAPTKKASRACSAAIRKPGRST
jgi:amidase